MIVLTTQKTLLLPALKQYFGFTSFRPLQQEIIRDALAGRDVVALLPTGGGKSLCFQLPAVIRPGLTVVVSPLIALMKDQVDALRANGIAATFLNSSLEPDEARTRLRDLHNGRYCLLYVAPERLMLPGFLDNVRSWNPTLIAIDEAHCISEWGHDFRPEYRQLSQLRGLFPTVPIMALTATATERVRDDIATLLRLRNPAKYIASFNRHNLSYRVVGKSKAPDQTLAFVRERQRESGIIYCASRSTTERVADNLIRAGIRAKPYHAGLTSEERTKNQDLFLRDEVQVMCATIAFGMGINKSNVRYVLHYDLPKSVEGYYQETGRAGRDGLPSECLMLYNPADAVKQKQFINEKPDAQERDIANWQLHQIVQYAESAECRRASMLNYFGETYVDNTCNGCDNCLTPRATFDGTIEVQKFLSCIYRIREKSTVSVGLAHVVEVLTGADTEKIRSWDHKSLSTYAIGKERTRGEWSAIGRELIRLGYVRLTDGQYSVVEITDKGQMLLRQRMPVTLTVPVAATPKAERDVPACNDELLEALRHLRKRLADERGVPAYVVFSDAALRQMAQEYPANEQEFARISGVGQQKLREFGAVFMGEIALHLQTHPRKAFTQELTAKPTAIKPIGDSVLETLRRFRAGETVEQIAQARGFVTSTIYGHLSEAIANGESFDLDRLLTAEQQARIANAFQQTGWSNIVGAREALEGEFEYGQLRVYRAVHGQEPHMQRWGKQVSL
ncbi:MAG: DNA helicase RecQ [Dehalococcoidia bacterium]|nr:DNA helicase RecQ [Dehalococcoidia bacterium]